MGVGAVHEDRADSEGPPVESCFFQESHHGQDAVVAAEVVVEPEFIDEAVAVLLQELDTFAAAARNPRGPRQRPEIVYAKDDRRRHERLFFHPTIIAARPRLCPLLSNSRVMAHGPCHRREPGAHLRHIPHAPSGPRTPQASCAGPPVSPAPCRQHGNAPGARWLIRQPAPPGCVPPPLPLQTPSRCDGLTDYLTSLS